MSVLTRLDRVLDAAMKAALVMLGLAVAGLMVLEVITRYILGEPWFGLEEVMLICVMWLYMIGASVACRERTESFLPRPVTQPIQQRAVVQPALIQ